MIEWTQIPPSEARILLVGFERHGASSSFFGLHESVLCLLIFFGCPFGLYDSSNLCGIRGFVAATRGSKLLHQSREDLSARTELLQSCERRYFMYKGALSPGRCLALRAFRDR
jgi:hypothetical protein